MTKKRKTKSKSKSKKSSTGRKQNRTVTLIVLAVAILFGIYFMATGSDPLGLFVPPTPTPSPITSIGSGGDWWQVYFTDPHKEASPENLANSVPEKLIENIDNAQKSIHIAAFEFNLTPVAEALISAHDRGVDVKWVTDDEYGLEADEDEDDEPFAMLEDAGIEVRSDDRSALMHNKFIIFDDQSVWTGSTNITTNGNFRNNNNVLKIDSPEVAAIFEREFEEMWDGEFGPTSPSTANDQTVMIDGTPVQVLFAAEDEVVSQLVPLLENAQNNIKFMAFSFTQDDLGNAMLERAKAGVEVTGIFETRGSETEYSEMSALHCAGLPVKQDGNPGTFHHKVIIIDDQLVVTGSLNFSENADDSNDENVVIVNNRDIAAQYLQEFDRRWAEGTEPNNDDVTCK